MGINRIFQFLVPKETKFFPLLIGQVEAIVKASILLKQFTSASDHGVHKEIYSEIKYLENVCDNLTDKIFDNLNSTFITPFDREDIHKLANQLDDVLDLITGSAKRVVLYQPKSIPSEIFNLASLLHEGALCLEIAVRELEKIRKNPEVVKKQCDKLHIIENKADDVHEDFLIKLFNTEKDAIELIKLKEISTMLERASDQEEDVAALIKTIMVKYA